MKKTLIEQAIESANNDPSGAGYELKVHFTSGESIKVRVYPNNKPVKLAKICLTKDGKDEYEEDLFINESLVTHVTVEWF